VDKFITGLLSNSYDSAEHNVRNPRYQFLTDTASNYRCYLILIKTKCMKKKEKEVKEIAFYFDLLQQHELDDIFYTSTFTLKRDNTGNILLYPDEKYVNKKACVYSHNSVIFEGDMPEMMLIAVQPGINPKHLHDILQLRIEFTSDEI